MSLVKVPLVHSTLIPQGSLILTHLVPCIPSQSLLAQLQSISDILRSGGLSAEAETLKNVYSLALLETDFGGLGYGLEVGLTPEEEAEILFLVSAWLESLNSADRSKSPIEHLLARPEGRRAMTLSEKIFAAHDIERRGQVKPGDAIRVDVDWIMASELSWSVRNYRNFLDLVTVILTISGYGEDLRFSRKARDLSQ